MKGIGRTIKRRRKEAKTDYHSRLRMLASGMPRLVVRKTNRYILAQLIHSDIAQDSVICGANSRELLNYGWPESLRGSLKSLAAAYLTGMLLAQKSSQIESKGILLDIGLQRNIKNGRIYATLKGCVDNGMKILHSAKVLPDEKHIEENKKTREVFLKLKEQLKHGRKGN